MSRRIMGEIDWSKIASAAIPAVSQLATAGIDAAAKAAADKKADAADERAADAAHAVDVKAALAIVELKSAERTTPAKVPDLQLAVEAALAAVDVAGLSLSPGARKKRQALADERAKKSAATSASLPLDITSKVTAMAWAVVSARIAAPASASYSALPASSAAAAATASGRASGSFLARRFGPIPVWGWGLIGVAVAGAATTAILLLRRKSK